MPNAAVNYQATFEPHIQVFPSHHHDIITPTLLKHIPEAKRSICWLTFSSWSGSTLSTTKVYIDLHFAFCINHLLSQSCQQRPANNPSLWHGHKTWTQWIRNSWSPSIYLSYAPWLVPSSWLCAAFSVPTYGDGCPPSAQLPARYTAIHHNLPPWVLNAHEKLSWDLSPQRW